MSYVFFGISFCIISCTLLFRTLILERKSIKCVLPVRPSGKAPPKKGPDTDYSKIFPPSQRQFLPEATSASSIAEKGHLDNNDLSISSKPILKLDDDYRLADHSTYVYSGFTVGDIKALGDFPDYAKLSGVPLPPPLKDFDVDNSPPRPYRPFRWPYHQTMCMWAWTPWRSCLTNNLLL